MLIGVDSTNGKVWLSMRQVQPDPLQQTLDALLAGGPPAATAPVGRADPGDMSYARGEPTSTARFESMV